MLDAHKTKSFMDSIWDREIVPILTDYIRIPNKSPAFDPQWAEHVYMEDAVKLMEAWARPQRSAFPGATLEVIRATRGSWVRRVECRASKAANPKWAWAAASSFSKSLQTPGIARPSATNSATPWVLSTNSNVPTATIM